MKRSRTSQLAALALLVSAPAWAQAPAAPDDELPEFLRERIGAEPVSPSTPAPPTQAPPVLLPDPGTPALGPTLPPSMPPAPPLPGDEPPYISAAPETPEEPESSAFGMGRMFSGRYVKPPTSVEDFAFGVHFQIAPVRAVAKQAIDDLKTGNPEVAPLIDLIQELDLTELQQATDAQREALFLSIPGLTDDQRAAVQDFDFESQRPAIDTVIAVVSDPEDAITFSLEPYFTLNLDLVSLSLAVPLAGFTLGGETSFEFGNLTLDTRFGHHWGDFPAFGLSYGLSISAPSGTDRADALALTNLLEAPKFLHRYLGLSPYVVGGIDLTWVIVQTSHTLNVLVGVRDEPRPTSSVYYGYTAGVIITPGDIISVDAEFAGLVNLSDAEAFGIHTFTGGLRFHVVGIRPGLAVQIPLSSPSGSFGSDAGLAYGSLADINVLIQADFGF